PKLLCFTPNKHVALQRPRQHTQVLRPTDERREMTFGHFLTSKASLNSAATVVNYDGLVEEGVKRHSEGVVVDAVEKRGWIVVDQMLIITMDWWIDLQICWR